MSSSAMRDFEQLAAENAQLKSTIDSMRKELEYLRGTAKLYNRLMAAFSEAAEGADPFEGMIPDEINQDKSDLFNEIDIAVEIHKLTIAIENGDAI